MITAIALLIKLAGGFVFVVGVSMLVHILFGDGFVRRNVWGQKIEEPYDMRDMLFPALVIVLFGYVVMGVGFWLGDGG